MALGIYPFRCLDCNQRGWVNIWLFSKLQYAKCPKCLGMKLTAWPRKHYHLNFLNKLLMTFGANRYRCITCRCNFLSFRPCELLDAAASLPEDTDEVPEPERQA